MTTILFDSGVHTTAEHLKPGDCHLGIFTGKWGPRHDMMNNVVEKPLHEDLTIPDLVELVHPRYARVLIPAASWKRTEHGSYTKDEGGLVTTHFGYDQVVGAAAEFNFGEVITALGWFLAKDETLLMAEYLNPTYGGYGQVMRLHSFLKITPSFRVSKG